MAFLKTYRIHISFGLKDVRSGKLHTINEVEEVYNDFIKKINCNGTITPVKFSVPGVIICLNFNAYMPMLKEKALDTAKILAMLLAESLGQEKVSIMTPDKTYTLE